MFTEYERVALFNVSPRIPFKRPCLVVSIMTCVVLLAWMMLIYIIIMFYHIILNGLCHVISSHIGPRDPHVFLARWRRQRCPWKPQRKSSDRWWVGRAIVDFSWPLKTRKMIHNQHHDDTLSYNHGNDQGNDHGHDHGHDHGNYKTIFL